MTMLSTPRLLLRQWRDDDFAPFAAMNADPRVMQYFPRLLSRAESNALATRLHSFIAANGFGFWAAEIPGIAPFIGFVGLSRPAFQAPFTPCVEIGWRLAPEYWRHGYATEAALACLAHGFGPLALPEIVAFTALGNQRSRQVMQRLGMRHDAAGDFNHPNIDPDHPISRHALFRLARNDWSSSLHRKNPE